MHASVLPTAGGNTPTTLPRPTIRREAESLLRRSGYLALRDITCETRDGVLHLGGQLPSYYLKQVAQAVASGALGVRLVVNDIEVLPPSGRAPTGVARAPRPRGS